MRKTRRKWPPSQCGLGTELQPSSPVMAMGKMIASYDSTKTAAIELNIVVVAVAVVVAAAAAAAAAAAVAVAVL